MLLRTRVRNNSQLLSPSGKSSGATERRQRLFGTNVPSLLPVFHLREETIHGAQTNGHTDKWDSPAPRHTFKYAVKKKTKRVLRMKGAVLVVAFHPPQVPGWINAWRLLSCRELLCTRLSRKSWSTTALFLLEFLAFLHDKFVLDVSSLPLGSLETQRQMLAFVGGGEREADFSLSAAASAPVKGKVQLILTATPGSCDIQHF